MITAPGTAADFSAIRVGNPYPNPVQCLNRQLGVFVVTTNNTRPFVRHIHNEKFDKTFFKKSRRDDTEKNSSVRDLYFKSHTYFTSVYPTAMWLKRNWPIIRVKGS